MIPKFEVFSGIVQPPHDRTVDADDTQFSLNRRRIDGDNDIPSTRNDGASRKLVEHRIGEVPARDVDVHRHLVMKFNPLELGLPGGWMVLNLIENNYAVGFAWNGREETTGESRGSQETPGIVVVGAFHFMKSSDK